MHKDTPTIMPRPIEKGAGPKPDKNQSQSAVNADCADATIAALATAGDGMLERPVHEWIKDELLLGERGQPLGQVYGDQIRAEILRRATLRNKRYLLAGVIVAAVSALGSMIAAVATLIALYQLS